MREVIDEYLKIKSSKIFDMKIGSQNKTYLIDNNYVLKLYNKDTIRNEEERIEREQKDLISIDAKKRGINTITPLEINNRFIHYEKGRYFSFYPYTTYKSVSKLNSNQIINLTNQISKLHNTYFITTIRNEKLKEQHLSLTKYIEFHKDNTELYNFLNKHKKMLEILNTLINNSIRKVKTSNVISHNDLKRENILWNADIPYFIDWDACSYKNPSSAFNEYAYFLSVEDDKLNIDKYRLFINTYYKENKLVEDIDTILYLTLYGKMSWLLYSLDRSMYDDINEQTEGIKGIKGIIESFYSYLRNFSTIKKVYEELL